MSIFRALCVVMLAATPAVARPGKVVRVERRLQRTGPVKLCEIKSNVQGVCFGDAPTVGDIVAVMDDQQVFAEVRLSEVSPLNATCDAMWNVRGEVLRGDLSNSQWGRSIGVVDARLDRRAAHKFPDDRQPAAPSGRSDEKVIGAIDRGNAHADASGADIVLTQYSCDTNGAANPAGNEQCFDLWSRDHPGGWRRVRQMLLNPCFR